MSWQTLLVENPGKLSCKNNQLICHSATDGLLSLPLEEIHTVILESHHCQITTALLAKLQSQGVVVVTCDERHLPNGLLMPFHQHSRYSQVVQLQVQASVPLQKRLWQQITQQKIANQAECLHLAQHPDADLLEVLIQEVQSGDKTNREAVAAKLYWPRLFGNGFKRFDESQWVTSALNYGYAILRATMARAVAGSGLMPCFGLNHQNQLNAFNLVDDLIEPFRPFIDWQIFCMARATQIVTEQSDLPITIKHQLATISNWNCKVQSETMSIAIACQKVSETLVRSLKEKEAKLLILPEF